MKVLYTVYKKYKRNRHGSGEPWLLFWVLSRSVDTLGSLPNFLAHRDENHRQDDGENCNPHTHLTHLRSNDENHHHHEGEQHHDGACVNKDLENPDKGSLQHHVDK